MPDGVNMSKAPQIYDASASIGLKQIGALSVATQDPILNDHDRIKKIDDIFAETGGNLVDYAQKSRVEPIVAARTLVSAGQMSQADPRFVAAFDISLEGKDKDFTARTLDFENVSGTIKKFSAGLKEEGSRDAFLNMKAIEKILSERQSVTPQVASTLEKIALSHPMSEEMQSMMFQSSARQSSAHVEMAIARSERQSNNTSER